MALVLCPICKQKGFTWALDDNEQTHWHCSLCEYSAEEDESKEKPCPICQKETGAVLLMHDGQSFYWCVLCGGYYEQVR